MTRLSTKFYEQPTLQLAKKLLGCKLVVRVNEELCSGLIVETEAYLHRRDPACHAARGETRRNQAMFASAGHAYVYSIHAKYCLNVVSEAEGLGAAVLIRALEPVDGLPLLEKNRTIPNRVTPLRPFDLTNGPGKLCQALQIDLELNRQYLPLSADIWIETGAEVRPRNIRATGRIGIREGAELPYRFFVDGNRYVSGRASDHSSRPISSLRLPSTRHTGNPP